MTTAHRLKDQVPAAKDRNNRNTAPSNGAPSNGAPSETSSNGTRTAPPAGRDANGRFTHGNTLGAGNPFARQVAGLRTALVNRMTPADMEQIADEFIARAKKGDHHAAKIVLSYTIGKPTPAPDPDLLAQDEWNIMRGEAKFNDDVQQLSLCVGPEPHLNTVRAMRFLATEKAWGNLRNLALKLDPTLQGDPPTHKAKRGKDLREAVPTGSFVDMNVVDIVAPSTNGKHGEPAA